MKIYKMRCSGTETRFCFPSVDENSEWNQEHLSSNEYKAVHEIPIPLVVDNNYEPYDYLVSKNTIISKRTFDLLKSLNDNLEGFESQMYLNGNKIWDIYYTAVFPKYEIMNMEKSEYKTIISRVSGKQVIYKIKKLVFSYEKLKKITNDNFFAMEELPVGIYCTEVGKNAIEEAGLIGFAFEEVPVE